HESGAAAIFKSRRGTKAIENLSFLLGAQSAAGAAACQEIPSAFESGVDKLLLDVINQGLVTRLSRYLCDPGTHGASAKHCDFFRFAGHRLSRLASRVSCLVLNQRKRQTRDLNSRHFIFQ